MRISLTGMKLQLLLIAFLALPLFGCGNDDGDSKPLVQIIIKGDSKGYRKYISSCFNDIHDDKICRCQADLLRQNMDDAQILVVADAGVAASNADVGKIDRVMKDHPEILDILKRLSDQAEACTK